MKLTGEGQKAQFHSEDRLNGCEFRGANKLDRDAILRLLDVNLNRAAEGLRTLEDIARVVREDVTSATWLKSLRHALGQLADGLPRVERLAARSVQNDAGSGLTHPLESERKSWSDLVTAATERVTQSLRVIEEASKVEFSAIADEAKQLRYRAYDQLAWIESRLLQARPVFTAPPLYLLIDCQLPVDRFSALLRELVAGGVGLIQIRDKTAEAQTVLRYARAAIEAVGANRVIINDRVDLAIACGAAGVHVGQEDLSLEQVRLISRGRLWVGVSTHSIDQAIAAEQAGADYIGCGPTFCSTTKRFEQFAGIELLQQVAKQIRIPTYAIGGIDTNNVGQVVQAGIGAIAVSGALLSSADPCQAARMLAAKLAEKVSR